MIDKIRERIRKLLALADNNPSPEEASAAASKAAELALEYGLELDRIRNEKGEQALPPGWFYLDDEVLPEASAWVGQLATALCEANGCRFFFINRGSEGWQVGGAGRKEAQDIVRLSYAYIMESLRRTQRQYISKARLGSAKARREYRYAYRMGYTLAVAKRVKAWADGLAAQGGKNALVLYRGDQLALVDEFVNQSGALKQMIAHPVKPINPAAYAQGAADGQQVSVNRQMEAAKQAERARLA